MAKRMKIDP